MRVEQAQAISPDGSTVSLKHIEGFMRPIIKLMLTFKVSMPAFIALIKKLFLEEGRKRLEKEGRRASVTGLAMASGCDDLVLVADFVKGRKTTVAQIGDLLEQEDDEGEKVPATTVVTTVLERWRQDPLYLDPAGNPVSLPIVGMAGRSFDGLVRRAWSGRMGYGPILDEMLALGVAKTSGHGEAMRVYLWETADSDAAKPKYAGDAFSVTGTSKILVDGEIKVFRQPKKVSSIAESFYTACRSLKRFVSTVGDNVLLHYEGRAERGIFLRTEHACTVRRLPASKYWKLKALSYEAFDKFYAEWSEKAEKLELPITAAKTTQLSPAVGIGFYFFDERTDPYDVEDISMPEIVALGNEDGG